MATNLDMPDFKKQFRGMVHGAQSLTVAYIGVVNDLFAGGDAGHADPPGISRG